MSELSQYEDFTARDITELWRNTNRLAKQGYKILETIPLKDMGTELFLRTMYLSTSIDLSQYEGFDNVDIGTDKQFQYEKLGYRGIANYSKHITWAKPKMHQPKLSVVREALVEAYNVVENWDTKDDDLPNNITKWLEVALDELEGTNTDKESTNTEVS